MARSVPGRLADRLAGNAVDRASSRRSRRRRAISRTCGPSSCSSPAALRANALQLAALKAELRAMAPRYAEIAVPTEILHGTADAIVPLDVHAVPLGRGRSRRAR